MDTGATRVTRRPTSGLTVIAHLFGILALILVLFWLLHYRGGLDLDSGIAEHVFNVSP